VQQHRRAGRELVPVVDAEKKHRRAPPRWTVRPTGRRQDRAVRRGSPELELRATPAGTQESSACNPVDRRDAVREMPGATVLSPSGIDSIRAELAVTLRVADAAAVGRLESGGRARRRQ
jgi:hypothetical protein